MAPVSAASFSPFCGAKFADALTNEPGWNHTITDAPDAGSGFGVHTFNCRQFSLPEGSPVATLSCAHDGGAVVAFSVSGPQAAAGCGRCHRRLPVGGAANGMPKKAHDAPRSMPCTPPLTVAAEQVT